MATPTNCFVSINGQEEGPLTFEAVIAKLARGEIQLTDYMFNEILQDWIPLLEVPAVQDHLRAKKPAHKPNLKPVTAAAATKVVVPAAPVVRSAETRANEPTVLGSVRDWFVLKWDTRVGPFSTLELVHMMQEKAVFEFEFVWKQGMDGWKRIADLENFQTAKIRQMYESEKNQVFIQREHVRVPFVHHFMAHDGSQLWKGEGCEISVGGARVKMEYAPLLPGQMVTMHVNGTRDLEAFNVQSEIVGKKFQAGRLDRHSQVEYVLKFINLDDRIKSGLKGWIVKQAS